MQASAFSVARQRERTKHLSDPSPAGNSRSISRFPRQSRRQSTLPHFPVLTRAASFGEIRPACVWTDVLFSVDSGSFATVVCRDRLNRYRPACARTFHCPVADGRLHILRTPE